MTRRCGRGHKLSLAKVRSYELSGTRAEWWKCEPCGKAATQAAARRLVHKRLAAGLCHDCMRPIEASKPWHKRPHTRCRACLDKVAERVYSKRLSEQS